jgi:hypothetical protein
MVLDVADLNAKLDALMKDIAARKTAAAGDQAKLQALQNLETRIGAGGGGGRGGRGGGGAAAGQVPPIRTRLGGLLGNFTISGATTGTLLGPSPAQMATMAEVKRDLAAIEKELSAIK